MTVSAHIGNIPLEEWLPFVVPLVVLYVYGRHALRRRRRAVGRLPGPGAALDPHSVQLVRARWAASGHDGLDERHLAALYPPGPDGLTAEQLAERSGTDTESMRDALGDLRELGYLDLDDDGTRAWLTFRGFELIELTESALLEALSSEPKVSSP